jgi:hypothetical protein
MTIGEEPERGGGRDIWLSGHRRVLRPSCGESALQVGAQHLRPATDEFPDPSEARPSTADRCGLPVLAATPPDLRSETSRDWAPERAHPNMTERVAPTATPASKASPGRPNRPESRSRRSDVEPGRPGSSPRRRPSTAASGPKRPRGRSAGGNEGIGRLTDTARTCSSPVRRPRPRRRPSTAASAPRCA